MKAIWNGATLAESDDTIIIEGNHYFPANSLNREFFKESVTSSSCPWKGTASYHNITVNGETNRDAAWFYAEPKEAAKEVKERVAFWKGVQISG